MASTDWPGPPLVLGGEGRSVPPPSAAVFVFAKPAAPTVLSVFARYHLQQLLRAKLPSSSLNEFGSASLELSVIFAPLPTAAAALRTLHHRMFSASQRAVPALAEAPLPVMKPRSRSRYRQRRPKFRAERAPLRGLRLSSSLARDRRRPRFPQC